MPDRPTPFPPDLTIAETRAAAYQLRALAARLLALAHQLPLPPEEDLNRILEGGTPPCALDISWCNPRLSTRIQRLLNVVVPR